MVTNLPLYRKFGLLYRIPLYLLNIAYLFPSLFTIMRYQKLITQETTWKWQYLLKKYREGENITKHEEQSLIDLKIQFLSTLQDSPEEVEKWIKSEMTTEQRKKMRQSVRAKRKRFFNAEKQATKKNQLI